MNKDYLVLDLKYQWGEHNQQYSSIFSCFTELFYVLHYLL